MCMLYVCTSVCLQVPTSPCGPTARLRGEKFVVAMHRSLMAHSGHSVSICALISCYYIYCVPHVLIMSSSLICSSICWLRTVG